ncbi:MAG TPA: F0F1 ATP synthase subunit A [Dehalococcoidia bacterium]
MFSRRTLVLAPFLAAFVLGFIFLRGPTPHISIKAEEITTAGPVGITNTMITSWIVTALLIVVVFLSTRRWELVPKGVQNVIEAIVEGFYGLVVSIAGEKNGRKFFPVVATIFFFILAANWLSLLPIFNVIGKVEPGDSGFVMHSTSIAGLKVDYAGLSGLGHLSSDSIDAGDANATDQANTARGQGKVVGDLSPYLRGPNTDLNTTAALAIISAIAVESWGIAAAGVLGYGRNFIRLRGMLSGIFSLSPAKFFEGFIDAFVGFLELVSELVRLLSFSARLFGNMIAGEIVILMFTFMAPLFVGIIFYAFELFVGIIQAFIFATLTVIFGMMAISHGEHAHESPGHAVSETEPIELAA